MSHDDDPDGRRRFLLRATAGVGGSYMLAAAYPMLASLAPSERARAAGAPCGPFQPFGGECRPQPHARLGPFDLGNGAQTYQVLQQAEEVGQVGVHAVHVAEVRVRMHAGAG